MSKVFIFLANGFEEIEAISIIDILRRAEIDVLTVSITRNREVTGSHRITVTADALFENVNFEEGEMLILPGGMPGSSNLQNHKGLADLLLLYSKQLKKISAICAAPKVLGNLGLLQGKKAVCYPGYEEELKDANLSDDGVVMDGTIITGKGPALACEFSFKIVAELKGEEAANRIASAMQF
jgi:protein deglycase